MEINGLAAIVTGGGSGLGAETARQLAAKGAKVALFDVNMEGAQAVAAEIGGLAIDCDVTSDEGVAAAIAQAQAAHGVARILINAAGIAPAKRIIDREGNATSLDYFRKGIEINLVGAYNVMSKAAAEMSKADPVNAITSAAWSFPPVRSQQEGRVGQASYSASKMGLMGMVPPPRASSPASARVNTINPGVFETHAHQHARGSTGIGQAGAVSGPSRHPGRIRPAGDPHGRKRLHQRRNHSS